MSKKEEKKLTLYKSRCCESGCDDCPFGFVEKTNPELPSELQKKDEEEITDEQYLEYLEDEYDI